MVSFYNTNLDSKDLTNLDRLKDSLLDMKNNLVDTVQTLHLRETEFSHTVEKSEELNDKNDELLINARKVKKLRLIIVLIPAIIIVFVVYCILLIMCRDANCSI